MHCVLLQELDKHISIYLRINLCPPYDTISQYQTVMRATEKLNANVES